MKKSLILMGVLLAQLGWLAELPLHSAPEAKSEPHRSPIDVAVLPGGRLAVTANHSADSVTLIDLANGKVVTEQPCGRKPAAVACSADGKYAAVSNSWSGTLTLFEVQEAGLKRIGEKAVGHLPHGLVFAPDGKSLYIALSGSHEVVQFDWQAGKVTRRWPAPMEPRRLALTRDGNLLAAASSRSAQVRCWDTRTGKQIWERTLLDSFNLHGLALSPDDKELVTAQVFDRHHPIAKQNIEQGWALDNRLGRVTLEPDKKTDYWQISLDTRGKAVADPCAAAFSTKGDWLVVAAAGSHELLLLQAKAPPWNSGDPGDFLDASLDLDDKKFRRLPVEGRPVAVQFIPDSDQVVVANYLLDAIQVVDVKAGKIVRSIPLGGPSKPGLARQGEAIFYDAKRSHHQWFSCHTCHPDGHTSGHTFDTLNDDSYGNPKLTPTLRGVTKSGPWTWHGWQDQLSQAVEKSLIDTMSGPKPSTEDVKAMLAYFETLDHPPSPRPTGSLSKSAERGKVIFQEKGRCIRCHQGEQYTSAKNYDVKLEADNSPFELWNPPSLRGVGDRGPYLHEGRAETLDEVLKLYHAPEKLGGQALTVEERGDLIEFLKSL